MRRTEFLKASPPMFESPALDRMTRVHHVVPIVVYVPLISVLAGFGLARLGVVSALALMAAGYVLWTLAEYWIHRVVFHFEPEEGLGARLHWMIHGVHHDHPNDPLRLVMPPSVSLPGAAFFLLLFWLVVGGDRWLAVGAGFLAGYVVYDMVHYHLHHRTPRTRAGRWLREHHMRHHFQDDESGFGISAPYWDKAFGTSPSRRGEATR